MKGLLSTGSTPSNTYMRRLILARVFFCFCISYFYCWDSFEIFVNPMNYIINRPGVAGVVTNTSVTH